MFRRDFFKLSILTAASLTTVNATVNKANSTNTKNIKTKIAICGGGFAGLSCAKQLKSLNPNLDVTIIEKRANFSSCPFSNAWLGEIRNISYEDLNYDYNSAIEKYGYNFINATISDINKDTKIITTEQGNIEYEYLVMAVGIDYNYKKLFRRNEEKAKECEIKAPAGLKPGSEHIKLKRMIKNFKGGNFIISIPSQAYKCPPAPYERACMIAHYFKENKIDGKVIIIDPRVKPAAKPERFKQAFEELYKDTIEYKTNTKFKDINFEKKEIYIESFNKKTLVFEKITLPFEEASIIPPNTANKLIKKAGLDTYVNGWAKLRQPTFRSVSDENIYVIGDSQGEYPYPKSAQMANSCGYLVAEELINRIKGEGYKYKTYLPGNVCYSMVSDKQAVSISHLYKFTDKVHVTSITSEIDTFTADAADGWYFGLIEDILGIES